MHQIILNKVEWHVKSESITQDYLLQQLLSVSWRKFNKGPKHLFPLAAEI